MLGRNTDLMPKLANNYYNYESAVVYDYNKYSRNRTYSSMPEHHSAKSVKHKKKKNYIQFLISLFVLAVFVFGIMPFAFKNITVGIFHPTPYNNININLKEYSIPTLNYISNSYFLNEPAFVNSVSLKKPQMLSIKENVSMPVLEQSLNDLAAAYPQVTPSVYVLDFETGNYVNIDADKSYATASIIKIPVLINLLRAVDKGLISLNEKMPLTNYYRTEGSGSLQFKAENSVYKIDDLARLMITESDNSSTNMIVSKLGSMADINSAMLNWGLKNSYMKTWLPDLDGTNRSTAKEIATMLYNIEENENFLSAESKQKIYDYMGHVHNNRLIHAGLGSGAVFYHKTGDIGKMLGDAGIVIAPNGKKYIVVILANRPHNSVLGKDYIVKASEIIYNYMVR